MKKQDYVKLLLSLEWVVALISGGSFLTLIFTASYIDMSIVTRILLIAVGIVILMLGVFSALKIEQVAGYYECNKCHHKYIPTYNSVLFAMHINRTRYMKCPKCGKRSWSKKVVD